MTTPETTYLDRAADYVRDGQSYALARLIVTGRLHALTEFELRANLANALVNAAELREKLEAEAGFGNPVLQTEAMDVERHMDAMGFARVQRNKALEIRLNPDGKRLEVQIEEMFIGVTVSPGLKSQSAPVNK
ncbi:MAG TPA: hypothetical protein VMR81_05585 [Patescibacteria group bacterium]|nr:hypothetical protein [Patescibacteria group bacterium]